MAFLEGLAHAVSTSEIGRKVVALAIGTQEREAYPPAHEGTGERPYQIATEIYIEDGSAEGSR